MNDGIIHYNIETAPSSMTAVNPPRAKKIFYAKSRSNSLEAYAVCYCESCGQDDLETTYIYCPNCGKKFEN